MPQTASEETAQHSIGHVHFVGHVLSTGTHIIFYIVFMYITCMSAHTEEKQTNLCNETKNKATFISQNFRQMTRSNLWTVSLSMAASQAHDCCCVRQSYKLLLFLLLWWRLDVESWLKAEYFDSSVWEN